MKEIVVKDWEAENRTPSGKRCPACGGNLTYGSVPCPDNRPGCCVAHFGFRCESCGKYWQ